MYPPQRPRASFTTTAHAIAPLHRHGRSPDRPGSPGHLPSPPGTAGGSRLRPERQGTGPELPVTPCHVGGRSPPRARTTPVRARTRDTTAPPSRGAVLRRRPEDTPEGRGRIA